jgi:phosphoglycolate phosphatase-like HAD superfamily hydrolase
MKFTAIAWDVDGTLVDSEPLHHRALLAACHRFGLDLSHIPETRFYGVHINDVWLALRADLPADLDQMCGWRRLRIITMTIAMNWSLSRKPRNHPQAGGKRRQTGLCVEFVSAYRRSKSSGAGDP